MIVSKVEICISVVVVVVDDVYENFCVKEKIDDDRHLI